MAVIGVLAAVIGVPAAVVGAPDTCGVAEAVPAALALLSSAMTVADLGLALLKP